MGARADLDLAAWKENRPRPVNQPLRQQEEDEQVAVLEELVPVLATAPIIEPTVTFEQCHEVAFGRVLTFGGGQTASDAVNSFWKNASAER